MSTVVNDFVFYIKCVNIKICWRKFVKGRISKISICCKNGNIFAESNLTQICGDIFDGQAEIWKSLLRKSFQIRKFGWKVFANEKVWFKSFCKWESLVQKFFQTRKFGSKVFFSNEKVWLVFFKRESLVKKFLQMRKFG